MFSIRLCNRSGKKAAGVDTKQWQRGEHAELVTAQQHNHRNKTQVQTSIQIQHANEIIFKIDTIH